MNKSAWVRWILVIVMLLCLTMTVSSPSLAEGGVLPLDYTVGGNPPKADGWIYDESGEIAGYKDATIEMELERGTIQLTVKGKKVNHETMVVRVRIADVSQLRTAVSKDTYKGRGQAKGEDMAKSKNAVVAMNGDFFKYENDVGYVVRQGEFLRDATDNKRGRLFDMLVIDSAGDFHAVNSATTEKVDQFIASQLTPFNLTQSEVARQGAFQWKYPQQRIALVQMGTLEYAIVEVFGRTDSSAGMSLPEFAEFVAQQCPDALLAYNLDGGGSTNLVVNGKRACKTPGLREITDIIYFASAEE